MKISDLLSPTDVMIDVRVSNKRLPAEDGQIGALAQVARKLRPPENLARLRGANCSFELYSAVV